MRNPDWEIMHEPNFDALLAESLPEVLPEEIAAEVTPWRKAMRRVLIGTALCSITLNFWCLNYILPAIGMVLSLLGFRALRHENRWFGCCHLATVIRAVFLFSTLIGNTTILQRAIFDFWGSLILTTMSLALQFLQLLCFWRGLRAVQQKAGLPPRTKGAVSLIAWYTIICLLALIRYQGYLLAILLIIAYFFILRSLWELSRVLDTAGYAIQTAPVRITDRTLTAAICAVLLVGCVCGYLFGNSYRMNWMPWNVAEHQEVTTQKEQLLALGFPEYVLNDLSAEDIAACDGALQVLVDVNDHPVNDGRTVITETPGEPGSGIEREIHYTTVYDVKELRITGVAVEIPGERETWIIFHHFLWTTNPGFYGTESIQLWPPYQHHEEGWGSAGDVTGRILYEKDGITYTSPYHSLGEETYTSSNIFWGESTSTDIFATFSMPKNGENHRGYLAYPIVERQDGWITDAWINYTHQNTWLQYPVMTAMEKRIVNGWSDAGAFRTIQDALQFYANEDGAKLLFEDEE